ncbi:MAG: sigma-70 family RNA polymerase sigma factor [Candidatus Binataceae bacterium]
MPPDNQSRFEEAILPHLDAAYNLARWLMRNDNDAEDAVQDACLRALRFIGGFRGGDARVWLLAIVRNTCFTKLKQDRAHRPAASFDEELHGSDAESASPGPEAALLRSATGAALTKALEDLPAEFREIIVMRELDNLSYKEIAGVTGVPIGTVMSRLARARKRLRDSLSRDPSGELA